jgi:hypothetical protein
LISIVYNIDSREKITWHWVNLNLIDLQTKSWNCSVACIEG